MNTSINVIINLALFSALAVAGSQFEATDGQTVTIHFDIDEVEKSDLLRITFKGYNEGKRVIAQRPWRYDDPPPPGISLKVGEGRVFVTIQEVNSSRSGLYEAQAFLREKMSVVKATLVVNRDNQASFSSTITPPNSSTPKPLNYDLLWLLALIPLVVLLVICLLKRRKLLCFENQEPVQLNVIIDGCKENGKALLTHI